MLLCAYKIVMEIDAIGTFNCTKASFETGMKVSYLIQPLILSDQRLLCSGSWWMRY